ncbi:MAG: MFS transporter [Candidatus Sericytochromatia bacterium]|nr:MFS transporter [Candidatus Sericytochromatia bacterium]
MRRAPSSWPVHAWALYDFASTAFYMNFISTYFALWVVKDQGATDLTYGLTKSASMLLVALASPLVGAWSDRVGRRKPFLLVCTSLFILGGLTLGLVRELWMGLIIFGLANVGLQLSAVFYNAMLPQIATHDRMGRVSGYGRAIGQVGSLSAVALGMAFATGQLFGHPVPGLVGGGTQAVFWPTTALALLAALPLLLTPEPPLDASTPHASNHSVSWLSLIKELWHNPALKGAALLLVSSFLFFDTINTIRDFMSIYLVRVIGLSETDGSLQRFLFLVVFCALLGALGWGWLADKLSPKRALIGVLTVMFLGFTGLVFIHDPTTAQRLLGPVLGVAFGGVLVTVRPLLADLVPAERRGEFFGLFVLCNDFAAILGPVTWGLIVHTLSHWGALAYQVALGTQLIFLGGGLYFLWLVPDPHRKNPRENPEPKKNAQPSV